MILLSHQLQRKTHTRIWRAFQYTEKTVHNRIRSHRFAIHIFVTNLTTQLKLYKHLPFQNGYELGTKKKYGSHRCNKTSIDTNKINTE